MPVTTCTQCNRPALHGRLRCIVHAGARAEPWTPERHRADHIAHLRELADGRTTLTTA